MVNDTRLPGLNIDGAAARPSHAAPGRPAPLAAARCGYRSSLTLQSAYGGLFPVPKRLSYSEVPRVLFGRRG
jgi:hypothetical protein